jgi:hypothetical protein
MIYLCLLPAALPVVQPFLSIRFLVRSFSLLQLAPPYYTGSIDTIKPAFAGHQQGRSEITVLGKFDET